MQSASDESVTMPDRERFAEPRHVPFYDRLHGRIIIGLFCSSVVFVLFNFGGVKTAVRYIASIVVHTTGDPITGDGGVLDKLKHKGEVGNLPRVPVAGAAMLPASIPGFGHKSAEQLKLEEEQRERDRQRREASERRTLLARAGVVKFDCDVDAPLEKLRVDVPLAEQRAAEDRKKKPLFERADKIGLTVDTTLDAKTLERLVEEAEQELARDKEYQAKHREWVRTIEEYERKLADGPNARCPNRRCGYVMRIGNPKGQGQCRRCLAFWPKSQAFACFTPPSPPKEPQPPKKNPGFFWRVFH